MNTFLSTLSCIPCRQEANDRAEMVNQILFGEAYSVIEKKDKWLYIKTLHDKYEGWIDHRQHEESQEADENLSATLLRALSPDSRLTDESGQSILISPGSPLPWACHGQIGLNGRIFNIHGSAGEGDKSRLIEFAMQFLNTPYLWGGRTIWGIDCSGFTQVVYAMAGQRIPRDASQQVHLGETVDLDNTQPGDLAFFHNTAQKITHVGIVLQDQRIIHASGKVRIDVLDTQGIKVETTNTYSHQLHSIKRL